MKYLYLRPLLIFNIVLFSAVFSVSADDLTIQAGDAYIELREDADGFDLYIRAKDNLGSVLITKSSADPEQKADSFAFRNWATTKNRIGYLMLFTMKHKEEGMNSPRIRFLKFTLVWRRVESPQVLWRLKEHLKMP